MIAAPTGPAKDPATVSLPAPPEQRTLYDLEATLDYGGHSLAVEERITYTNPTAGQLAKIALVVEAQRYPGVFRLHAIRGPDGERLFTFLWEGTVLILTLPQALAPGETTQFSLAYALQLLDVNKQPQVHPYPLGYSSLQANFGDWYPFIPPYSPGKGWLAHPPATYGEHLVYDIADFKAAIRFTDGREDLVIAASAPAQVDGEWRRYEHLAARSFAWSASPNYEVVTQTVETADGQSAVAASYYFPYHAEAGKSLLEDMAQAVRLYSRLFGAYPHPALAGVQVDFMDGMEYDGLYFLSTDFYNWHKDGPEDFLGALAAHETAHQWWGGVVGSDQALQPWLDEALCTYSERLFYENIYPEALAWWWAWRVNYYEPEGPVDISVYDVTGQYRSYRDPVYLSGALFFEELRGAMGDEAFFAALRAYTARYAYRQAEGKGFWEVMREHAGEDLGGVIEKYFKKIE
jgi:hypothetical protein